MELFIPRNATITECVGNQSASNTYKIWGSLTYGSEKTKWMSGEKMLFCCLKFTVYYVNITGCEETSRRHLPRSSFKNFDASQTYLIFLETIYLVDSRNDGKSHKKI